MSETEYVQPAIDVGFTTPMVDATAPPEDERPTFESNVDGLQDAAAENFLADETLPEPEPVIYTQRGGDHDGKPAPANQSVTAEQAARNLADYRNSKEAAKEQQTDALAASAIDVLREQRLAPVEQTQEPQQQSAPQQPEPQAVADEQLPPGIDPELARTLQENPRLREALHTEVQQIEAAKQTYLQGLHQNAVMASAAFFSSYPELNGLNQDQLKGAIAAIAHQNPQRASEIVSHIERTNATAAAWQQAYDAQYQQATEKYKADWAKFAQTEDAKFEKLAPEMADRQSSQRLADATVSTLRGVGFSNEDLQKAWNGDASISLRDHRAQLLLRKAALYDSAQAAASQKVVRDIPKVQRPGVSGFRADEHSASELATLSNRLRQTGNWKDAAKFLAARRANNR